MYNEEKEAKMTEEIHTTITIVVKKYLFIAVFRWWGASTSLGTRLGKLDYCGSFWEDGCEKESEIGGPGASLTRKDVCTLDSCESNFEKLAWYVLHLSLRLEVQNGNRMCQWARRQSVFTVRFHP